MGGNTTLNTKEITKCTLRFCDADFVKKLNDLYRKVGGTQTSFLGMLVREGYKSIAPMYANIDVSGKSQKKTPNTRTEADGGNREKGGKKPRLMRDGRRRDGVGSYRCPKCRRRCSDASNASLSSSKLTPRKIRAILTLITLDCPCWVIAEIADANPKTAQFWFGRCLDAAEEWSMGSKLSGHVWIDEMRFAPTRASGSADGGWATYAGKIARDACVEAAFDSSGRGFCHLYAKKLGTPTKAAATEGL